MKRPKLNKLILNFMERREYTWYRKVSLYQMFEDWSPETIGRTLRSLESKGLLDVGYYKGKYGSKLARYKLPENNNNYYN